MSAQPSPRILLDFPAPFHSPNHLHLAITHTNHFLVHVGHFALVQGDHMHFLAHAKAMVTLADVDMSMFHGHTIDTRLRVLDDQAVGIRRVRLEGLLPAIDDDAIRPWARSLPYRDANCATLWVEVLVAVDARHTLESIGSTAMLRAT